MRTKRGQNVPLDIAKVIKANKTALIGFQHMPPSHQHEYLSYILEAKKPETRAKRIKQSMVMMARWEREHQKRHKRKR